MDVNSCRVEAKLVGEPEGVGSGLRLLQSTDLQGGVQVAALHMCFSVPCVVGGGQSPG